MDKALTRPGRLDRHINVTLPDVLGRSKILKVHARKLQISPKIDFTTVARGTTGFSGAELANLINQAAIRAARFAKPYLDEEDLEWAKDKVMMGSEQRSRYIPKEGLRKTAYHEGGHALVGYFNNKIPHKVTIMPRGNSLGVNVFLPKDDTSRTRKELREHIDICMGGRAAEELILGEEGVTSGCVSDLEDASRVAQAMVLGLGMGKEGVRSHWDREELGVKARREVDNEVRGMLKVRMVQRV